MPIVSHESLFCMSGLSVLYVRSLIGWCLVSGWTSTRCILVSFPFDSFQVFQCNPSRLDHQCNVTFSFQGTAPAIWRCMEQAEGVCHNPRCGVSVRAVTTPYTDRTRSRRGQCELSPVWSCQNTAEHEQNDDQGICWRWFDSSHGSQLWPPPGTE